jgi:hypothetical protein
VVGDSIRLRGLARDTAVPDYRASARQGLLVVRIPDRWRFTAEQRKEYETDHVSHLEFRRSPVGDGEILVAAWALASAIVPRIYSSNAYRIPTTVGRRPHRASDKEWTSAELMRVNPSFAEGCNADEKGVLCGDKRFDRTHTTPRVGEIGNHAYRSPDGHWLALDSWDGRILYQKKSGGILGDFPGSGGIAGARGNQFVDIFEFATVRRVVTAGGSFNGWPDGAFRLSWLPPHYLVGVMDRAQLKFLFCNPVLAEKSE